MDEIFDAGIAFEHGFKKGRRTGPTETGNSADDQRILQAQTIDEPDMTAPGAEQGRKTKTHGPVPSIDLLGLMRSINLWDGQNKSRNI